jgi:hypothetical protein
MVIPRASVPFAILMQPQSFDAFNRDRTDGGAGGGVGGVAADSAIGRGFFGRSWLIRIAGFTVTEKSFGLGTGDEGGSGVDGALGPVGGALLALEGVLEQVLMRGEQYRARLGVFIGWQEALGGAPGMTDAVGVVPVPGLPARDWLTLTAEAVGEYGVVQDIRTALSAAVQRLEVEASGSETVLMPMASRWTQHVLRVAAVLTLLADPGAKVIEGWAVRDAGQRIVPWLLEHWCREMTDYQEAALAATLEQEIKFNPRGADLTPLGQVVEVMVGIAKDQLAAGIAAEPSWSRGEVLAKLRNKVRGAARTAVYKSFADAFDQMIAEGVLKKNTAEPKPGKGGRPAVWFTPGPIVGKYFKNAW